MSLKEDKSYLGFGRLWNCSKTCDWWWKAGPPSRCIKYLDCPIKKGQRPMFLISITRDWNIVFEQNVKRFETLDATAIPPYYVYTCVSCGLSVWIDGFKYQDLMKKLDYDTLKLFSFLSCCDRNYFEFNYQFTEPEGTELTYKLLSAIKVLI